MTAVIPGLTSYMYVCAYVCVCQGRSKRSSQSGFGCLLLTLATTPYMLMGYYNTLATTPYMLTSYYYTC